MTEDEKKRLSIFEARLRHLLFLYDELERENVKLSRLLKEEKEKYEKILGAYKELEAKYTNTKIAATINQTVKDVKETKLRLSKLVREVDKCIALLNE
jgi:3-methyladenine DNA glycosylase AlkC